MAGVQGQVVEYREFLEAAEAEYSRHLVRINAEEAPEDVYLSFCDAIESSLWASAIDKHGQNLSYKPMKLIWYTSGNGHRKKQISTWTGLKPW